MSVSRLIGLITAILLVTVQNPVAAYQSAQSNLELLSSVTQVESNESFLLGVHLTLKPGWHTYGPDSVGVGLPVQIKLKANPFHQSGDFIWPPSTPFVFAGAEATGYSKDEALILIPMQAPPTSVTQDVRIVADVSWLSCAEVCIPEQGTVSVDIRWVPDGPTIFSQAYTQLENRIQTLPQSSPASGGKTWLWMMGFAFLGGLILNVMPCVFPVLSLKLMSLAKASQQSRMGQLRHISAYTVGILACFMAVAAGIGIIQSTGRLVGWGTHFQSPWIVAGLAMLMIAVGLNLQGILRLPIWVMSGTGVASTRLSRIQEKGWVSDFFLGVLAVVVATPCTAPFMGPAIGWGLTLPFWGMASIFLGLGLGLASPFWLVWGIPGILRIFPKPGPWMDRFKWWLGIPMYLTAIWLIWVLVGQISGGRDLHYRYPVEVFSAEKLATYQEAGRPVLVDVTADWCLTCKVNQVTVLNTEKAEDLFKQNGLTLMVADWTERDPEITRYLAQFGRRGVPLYVLYLPTHPPQILPQILTMDHLNAVLNVQTD